MKIKHSDNRERVGVGIVKVESADELQRVGPPVVAALSRLGLISFDKPRVFAISDARLLKIATREIARAQDMETHPEAYVQGQQFLAPEATTSKNIGNQILGYFGYFSPVEEAEKIIQVAEETILEQVAITALDSLA